jgi:hypothetical protein
MRPYDLFTPHYALTHLHTGVSGVLVAAAATVFYLGIQNSMERFVVNQALSAFDRYTPVLCYLPPFSLRSSVVSGPCSLLSARYSLLCALFHALYSLLSALCSLLSPLCSLSPLSSHPLAFSALDFDTRREIFYRLPEMNVPMPEMAELVASSNTGGVPPLRMWAQKLTDVIVDVDGSFVVNARERLRARLLEEAERLPDLQTRLVAIASLLPPSVEREYYFDRQFTQALKETRWIPSGALELSQPQDPSTSCMLMTNIVSKAITLFPGPTNLLVFVLTGTLSVEQAVVQITDVPEEAKELSSALALVREQFETLPPELASTLLEASVAATISALPSVSGIWRSEPTPYQLYVKALDKNLVAPLATDARINEDLLNQVKSVFLALPADIQARVLLTAIRHPSNVEAVEKNDHTLVDAASMVRDLLSAGGIVSVKLAQMLAEHPKMPADYRLLLGSLRDSNAAMRPLDFWWRVPRAIRTKITHLGPCLGTGSVKQVQLAQFEGGTEYAVAILRKKVEDEALSSINALESASDDLGPVARRLGKMVFGEFDLFNEGESLKEFAMTSIGTHPLFRVVGVRHHSPNCLVEEPAKGRTIATVLDSLSTSPEEFEETKKILAEFHRTVFDAFISTGLIHSDIHLGNAVKVTQPSGWEGFVLFDVGQVDRVNNRDMTAIMWTMAALSNPERRSALRDIAIDHLLSTSFLPAPMFASEVLALHSVYFVVYSLCILSVFASFFALYSLCIHSIFALDSFCIHSIFTLYSLCIRYLRLLACRRRGPERWWGRMWRYTHIITPARQS